MQDNTAQCTGASNPTTPGANTISNTDKIAKMENPVFWVDMVVGILITPDSENWWLQVVASNEDTCNQNGKLCTKSSFPLSST